MSIAFDVRDATQLITSFEEAGGTAADLLKMQDPEVVQRLLPVIRGNAEVTMVGRILNCSKKLKLSEFLGPGWREIKKDRDERSFSLKEIDFENVLFEHCLKEGKTYITGEDTLNRLKAMKGTIRLGSNVFLALWEDYQKRGERSVLEWLRSERGIEFIAFPGSPLRGPYGGRCVLCLYWVGLGWRWGYDWLDRDWGAGFLSALLPVEPEHSSSLC